MQIGPYEVVGELGRGGMGVVYRARRGDLNREFALKVVSPGAGGSDPAEATARLRREAQAAAGLAGHPGIVAVHDIGEVEASDSGPGGIYVAMDVVDGGGLDQLIDQGELDPRRAATLVAQAARAVAFAHSRGILHRDLKPANVLIGSDGAPRIADFGLAISQDAGSEVSRLTKSGAIIGTPAYMPPEQARGEGLDVRADVYALGATLYETLTGDPPFSGDTPLAMLTRVLKDEPRPPRTRNPAVPRDLDTIALTCLAKAPEARYPNAEALAEDLERFARGEPIAARPVGALEHFARRVRRNPAAWGGIAAACAAVLALIGVVGVRTWQARAERRSALATAVALTPTDPDQALAMLRQLQQQAPGLAGLEAALTRARARRTEVARERLALQAQGLLDTGLEAARLHRDALDRWRRAFARRQTLGWHRRPPGVGEQEFREAERARARERDEAERQLDDAWAATRSALGAVLVVLANAPDLPAAVSARHELAAAARARVADAETRGDERARTRFLEILHRYAGPADTAFLKGGGTLTLDTDPSGATVECRRFENQGGRLEAAPFRNLGSTPLQHVPLPMGSYLLVLRHPDRPPLRYPVCIERQEDDVTPKPVLLPATGRVPAGFRYVPGGVTLLGGEFAADDAGPLRREWVDGFCMAQFEVTIGEYAEFIAALVARSGTDGTLTKDEVEAIHRRTPRQWRWANHYWKWTGRGFQIFGRPQQAVYGISVSDADAYCRWRSARDGRRYRLPSEAEWERAARGADGRAHPWGNGWDRSWYLGALHPVHGGGRSLPRPVGLEPADVSVFGIRDLAGSVKEICRGPQRPTNEAAIMRGGGRYSRAPSTCHAARRQRLAQPDVDFGAGFRLVTPLDGR